jgi:hypothetical protein
MKSYRSSRVPQDAQLPKYTGKLENYPTAQNDSIFIQEIKRNSALCCSVSFRTLFLSPPYCFRLEEHLIITFSC